MIQGMIYLCPVKLEEMDRLSLNISCCLLWILAILPLSGCARIMGSAGGGSGQMASVNFSFGVRHNDSVWLSGDAGIRDINIYVYHNGKLECSAYFEDAGKVGISIESGRLYRIYALANVGLMYPPVDEQALREGRYGIAEMDALQSSAVPMSASAAVPVTGTHLSIGMELSPLVAKLGLKVEVPDRGKFRVESIRIGNIASAFCPFADSCQATSVLEEAYLVPEDKLGAVNDGRIIYVHVPENCQGVFFQGNRDSRRKTPENLPPEIRGRCTYLEITVIREDVPEIFVFCLGRDAVSDCNVVRNTYEKVTLHFADDYGDYVWEVKDSVSAPGTDFIAGGESGHILYTDSQRELIQLQVNSARDAWQDIIYAGGKYVMAGDCGTLASSSDGDSWHTAEMGDIAWQALAYGEGKYVAVGFRTRSYPRRVTGYTAVSSDGMSWVLTEQEGYCLQDVAYGAGMFLASGSLSATGNLRAGHFFTLDGDDKWQLCGGLPQPCPCLIYGKGSFVALGKGRIMCSDDGVQWSLVEDTGCSDVCNMAYGGGTYVCTGTSGRTVYSLGGLDWSVSGISGVSLSGVSYGRGVFISTGKGGLVMISRDGESWERVDTASPMDLYCAAVKQ